MKALKKSLSKAAGIIVCVLPSQPEGRKARGQSKAAHSKTLDASHLKALEGVFGFSVLEELKRRQLETSPGKVHSLPCLGPSKVRGVVIGFSDNATRKKTPHRSLSPLLERESLERDAFLRKLAVSAYSLAKQSCTHEIFVDATSFKERGEEDARVLYESLLLTSYEYTTYKSKPPKTAKRPLEISFDSKVSLNLKALQGVNAVYHGVSLARDLVNTPPADMTPDKLVLHAKRLMKSARISGKTFNAKQLAAKRMNGILSVGKASANPPAFIALRYTPPRTSKKRLPLVGIIGKGVTFDSGGLSIKTGSGMETMKCDMAGAAAILGVFRALPELKLPIRVHGYIPTAENMIQGNAMRPGDVLTMMSGKTVEVLNTDAEGRLILADALHYATLEKCDVIIDLATLTGACVIALGEKYAALYANSDELRDELLKASERVDERCWSMPLVDDYKEQIVSSIADIKNIGSGTGGSITAALFLQHFVGDTPWAHLDIAGPAFASKADGVVPKGGTGFGVRTLLAYLESLTR